MSPAASTTQNAADHWQAINTQTNHCNNQEAQKLFNTITLAPPAHLMCSLCTQL
jgi:hypothetical protein